MESVVSPAGSLRGEIAPPPDKSISHRAVMFASIAKGESRIKNLLKAADPISTMNAFRALGVEITESAEEVIIVGKGLYGLREPDDVIDCGNSGTTIRLITGLLAGQPFYTTLTGDASLRKRPMGRIIEPLKKMGGRIMARADDTLAPVSIRGGGLKGIHHVSRVASAQVKSSIVLAGLCAEGDTLIEEPQRSRDHTERMLISMGADLNVEGLTVRVRGGRELEPFDITVPGDFSSAAFFIAGALIIPNSEITIKDTGINPTRTGLLEAIHLMGGDLNVTEEREVSGELVGNLHARYTKGLKGIELPAELVPAMIDEFPVFSVIATQAEGETIIRGASELRVKESDRIATVVGELRKMGAEIEELPDGMVINGPTRLKGGRVLSHGDHRLAMSLAVAGLVAEGETVIEGTEAVDISFPGFFELLQSVLVK
ncbi:MAG: 3-phosphoshikimate 1-carboxyvinyltransferase [Nitrospirae bacterium]|nr:MAG: 3-phosphoshikimate 1-carboxyvinyltransferase [Nitrospirota bacterium]